MDLDFSREDLAFRDEIRRFIDDNLTDELRHAAMTQTAIFAEFEPTMQWHRILHRTGWIAPSWPKEHGGTGWSIPQRYLFNREMTESYAPKPLPNGLGMVGPVIIKFGTPEQQQRYLPRILSGDDYWAQGYSEPGAGSDLASLRTRAVADGDHYVINGSKIWTTYAQYAQRMFCLVRTGDRGKPQQGISFLLFDMDLPGITVEPIITLGGDHEVNQVFFDDVRVPKSGLIGEENKGWTYAKYLLEWERGAGAWAPRLVADLKHLRRIAAAERSGGARLADEAGFAAALNELEVDLMALEMIELRIMSTLSKGGSPGPEASMIKVRGSEAMQRLTTLTMETVAYYAAPHTIHDVRRHNQSPIGPAYAPATTPHYLNARAASIYAGTNEVQRDIMAKLVLGL
ncbi:MAG: acyl-CoA dehydrogenase [Alphaproteobacteria bacterium]|nr:acyl-CoA dehydrogenase [Alphaproteobacteria bacterium]